MKWGIDVEEERQSISFSLMAVLHPLMVFIILTLFRKDIKFLLLLLLHSSRFTIY